MRFDSYSISLDVNSSERKFQGVEKIKLSGNNEKLILNGVEIEIKSISINGKETKFTINKEKEEIYVENPISGPSEIDIGFSGKVSDTLTGLYLAKTKEDVMFTTQFESSGARRVFPSVDDPGYKAEFSLSLTIDKDLDAISNMPIKESTEKAGRKTVTFETTPRMSTYLLYIGIGRFDTSVGKYDGKDVVLAAPKGYLSRLDKPIDFAKESLNFFENYFDIKYVLPKVHLVSVPDFAAGAMENWGAITFREVLLQVDESTSTRIRKLIASVIAHELAHQWFGNLVTMKWWNDLWLNESFATFMSAKAVHAYHPEWDMWGDLLLSDTSGAFGGDALVNSHPIEADVKNPDDVAQIFDEISYGKGGSILRMIESYVGEEKFRDGIRQYLKAHSYDNARGSDLWNSIGKVSNQPVNSIMGAWITKKGYPVIEVNKNGNTIRLRQQQFLLSGETTKEIWPIPLTIDRNGKVESILMEDREMEVSAENFLKLNKDQTGFYRVLYDEDTYKVINSKLQELSHLDRWGIASDLHAFLMSGKIVLDQYLERIGAFKDESNPVVVEEIVNQLFSVYLLMPDSVGIKDLNKKFLKEQIERLGAKKTGEPENVSILRGLISERLAIFDADWAKTLSERFERFEETDPDVRGAVAFSTALANNNIKMLEEKLEKLKSIEDKLKIISAMAWLSSESELEGVIDLIKTGKIRKQDTVGFYITVATNPSARNFMFKNLEFALEDMRKVFVGTAYPGMVLQRVLPYLGLAKEKEVRSFMERVKSPDIETGINKGGEILDIYLKFLERNR